MVYKYTFENINLCDCNNMSEIKYAMHLLNIKGCELCYKFEGDLY